MVPNQKVNPYLNSTTIGGTGTYTRQTYGGTIVGLSAPTSVITKAIEYKDINASDQTTTTLPQLLSGARSYNTAKVLSAGTFAYNAAKNRTWVMTRLTTTLAGVTQTFLQFVGAAANTPSLAFFVRDNYTNETSLIRLNYFSRTGYASNGTGFNGKIKARTTWIPGHTPTATAGTDFGTSTSLPTRAYPGELYILNNFVNYNPATSSNKYYYSPITGH